MEQTFSEPVPPEGTSSRRMSSRAPAVKRRSDDELFGDWFTQMKAMNGRKGGSSATSGSVVEKTPKKSNGRRGRQNQQSPGLMNVLQKCKPSIQQGRVVPLDQEFTVENKVIDLEILS